MYAQNTPSIFAYLEVPDRFFLKKQFYSSSWNTTFLYKYTYRGSMVFIGTDKFTFL